MPTHVVLPSVSLAAALQGTAFTVLVETPSSPTLSKPTVVPGYCGLPTGGAAPETGTPVDEGAPAAGGGAVGSTAGAGCCASAGADRIIRAAKRVLLRMYVSSIEAEAMIISGKMPGRHRFIYSDATTGAR
jgi:hypothetical protein